MRKQPKSNSQQPTANSQQPTANSQQHGRILVVDDEAAVRMFIAAALESAGHANIIEAEDGQEAYELVQRFGRTIKLVITDMQMPRMNGAELVKRLATEYPTISIVCMSGYSDSIPPAGHDFLEKPFSPATLLRSVEAAIRQTG